MPAGYLLVGHMSNQGGVFDGPGRLRAFDGTVETGSSVPNPTPDSPDFMEITLAAHRRWYYGGSIMPVC